MDDFDNELKAKLFKSYVEGQITAEQFQELRAYFAPEEASVPKEPSRIDTSPKTSQKLIRFAGLVFLACAVFAIFFWWQR